VVRSTARADRGRAPPNRDGTERRHKAFRVAAPFFAGRRRPGIDADLLPRLFERFVRADTSRSGSSGIGLGLAIVSSIVKAHHGSVTAESADGRTVFRVRLPIIEDPIAD